MTRNLIVLGCSALLAMALGLTSYAGVGVDFDSDGVLDDTDNCDETANGPLAGVCMAQQDGDNDGFGNACDTDNDNSGQTTLADVSATLAESKIGGTDSNYDYDEGVIGELAKSVDKG